VKEKRWKVLMSGRVSKRLYIFVNSERDKKELDIQKEK